MDFINIYYDDDRPGGRYVVEYATQPMSESEAQLLTEPPVGLPHKELKDLTFQEIRHCTWVWVECNEHALLRRLKKSQEAITAATFKALAQRELQPTEFLDRLQKTCRYSGDRTSFDLHPIMIAWLLQCQDFCEMFDLEKRSSGLSLTERKDKFNNRSQLIAKMHLPSFDMREFFEVFHKKTKKEITAIRTRINGPITTEGQIKQLLDPLKGMAEKYPVMGFIHGLYPLQSLLAHVIATTGDQLQAQKLIFKCICQDEILKKLFVGYRLSATHIIHAHLYPMPMAAAVRALAPHGSTTLREYLFTLLETRDLHVFVALCFSLAQSTAAIIENRKPKDRPLQMSDYFDKGEDRGIEGYSVLAEILSGLNQVDTADTFKKIFKLFDDFHDEPDKVRSFLVLFKSLTIEQPLVDVNWDNRNWLERLFSKKPALGAVYSRTMLATFFSAVEPTEIGPLVIAWFSLCVGEIVNGFFSATGELHPQNNFPQGKDSFAIEVIQAKLALLSNEAAEKVKKDMRDTIINKLKSQKDQFANQAGAIPAITALEKKITKVFETANWLSKFRNFLEGLIHKKIDAKQLNNNAVLPAFNDRDMSCLFFEEAKELVTLQETIPEKSEVEERAKQEEANRRFFYSTNITPIKDDEE